MAKTQGRNSLSFQSVELMTPLTLTLLAHLVLASAVHGQDAPIAGRPPNFSHLVGRYSIEAVIEPNEVVVEDPLTLREVGEKLKITRERVRQIEKAALTKIRTALKKAKTARGDEDE